VKKIPRPDEGGEGGAGELTAEPPGAGVPGVPCIGPNGGEAGEEVGTECGRVGSRSLSGTEAVGTAVVGAA